MDFPHSERPAIGSLVELGFVFLYFGGLLFRGAMGNFLTNEGWGGITL